MEIDFNLVDEQITAESILDYDSKVNNETYELEAFFDHKNVTGKYYDFTRNHKKQVMTARYHPLNTQTDLIDREKQAVSRIEIAYFKVGIPMDEDDLLVMSAPRTDEERDEALKNIYDDGSTVVRSIKEKMEYQRAEVLSTGKLNVDENGYKVEIDFGVPKENFFEFDWTKKDHDKLRDIMNVCDYLEDIPNFGERPSVMIAPKSIINEIRLDPNVRAALATYNINNYVTNGELSSWFSTHELPNIMKYDRKFVIPQNENMTITETYTPFEDKIVFLPVNAVGVTVDGLTPEELNKDATVDVSSSNGVTVQRMQSHDPEGRLVKASARNFSVLTRPENIAIATVKRS